MGKTKKSKFSIFTLIVALLAIKVTKETLVKKGIIK